ncbi:MULTISPECIES: ABC transporter ATP-binding protein [Gracilibacillus]|uniref:ABC transporter ATP-binding protein n=1 Tax=Gracilibacillus TaxID=74385 RepID=UPI00082632A9|nr:MULTISPECIES: ABC transporter ATP-binding protein [Gracilibacillus]
MKTTAPRSPLFQLQDFSFTYQQEKKPTIKQMSLSLYSDEITLLMGSSGSGKSTLALCLNGLYPEAVEGSIAGDIFFRGKAIQDYPKGQLNQQVGIVFQDPESQFCMIHVEDELAFVLENLSVPKEQMRSRMIEVLELVDMRPFIHHKIHHLSGGQKQKIALASTLLLEPAYLILDEPAANLDPMSRLELVNTITTIQQKRQLGILIIEHQAEDWIGIADRMLVLNQDNQLVMDDQPHTVFTSHSKELASYHIITPAAFEQSTVRATRAASNGKEIVRVDALSFHQKGRLVLNNISFSICKGEFLAILGENGAGKSTLLQLLSRLKTSRYGQISFHGIDIMNWQEQALRQRTGFVFQQPEHQFICSTVYDEISFGMRLNGQPPDRIDQRTEKLLQTLHLQKHRWTNPFMLSGGQKRRLSVAAMLDETPDLLLFDEPTFGQDAQTTKELLHLIEELRQQGTAIVFVTHDMDVVASHCERALVLHQGEIAFDHTPDELWKHPLLLQEARLRPPYFKRREKQKAGSL